MYCSESDTLIKLLVVSTSIGIIVAFVPQECEIPLSFFKCEQLLGLLLQTSAAERQPHSRMDRRCAEALNEQSAGFGRSDANRITFEHARADRCVL